MLRPHKLGPRMSSLSASTLSFLLFACAGTLVACRSSGDEGPLRSVPASECAPACVPASGAGLAGPSVCFDGCNYCRCTASGPRDCTTAMCLDAGRQLTYLPREQCDPSCTAVPGGLYFPDHTGPSVCYDGCNACLCTSEGLVHCTQRACPPDMGVDQGADSGTVDQGP